MRVQFNSIICATDLSDYSNQTINYGAALSKLFGSKLYVCHVVEPVPVAIYGEAVFDTSEQQNRIVQYATNQLEQLIKELPVDAEPQIIVGRAADAISRIAEEKEADMVITATRSQSGLKRLMLGSVTERLMRILACPLLILRGDEGDFEISRTTEYKIDKILVGCDFSSNSELALKHGLSLAQEFQSELHLAHVISPPVYQYFPNTEAGSKEILDEELEESYKKKLEEAVPEDAGNWCSFKAVLLTGSPHEELNKYARDQGMELIILGTRGIGLVESLLIGSTTDRVIRNSVCPVLSVFQKSV